MMHSKAVWIFIIILLLDQVTKLVATTFLSEGLPLEVVPNVFNLTLVHNPGAAFGLFSTLPDFWRRLVLTVVSCAALLVVFYFILREAKDDRISRWALSGILGGAVGNIIDRFRYDAVIDFLDFYWGQYHWPAFNIADSAISVGVFILILRVTILPKQ